MIKNSKYYDVMIPTPQDLHNATPNSPPICKHMHRPKHPFWVVPGLNKSLQHIGFIVLDGIGTELAKTSHNLKGMQGLGYGLQYVTGTYHIN